MYILPAILMTQPDVAKFILRYRADKYEAAIAHAESMGKVGYRYPWESAYSGKHIIRLENTRYSTYIY